MQRFNERARRKMLLYFLSYVSGIRSQCPHGLWRSSTAARLLRLWVRISDVSVVCCQVEVCCECCVLSGRGLL